MILDQIIADSRQELEARRFRLPLEKLRKTASEQLPPLDFASALCGNSIQLIAEIKRASPSRGVIRSDFNPVEIAKIYTTSGASAISVLTETKYFHGSLEYLKAIRTDLGYKKPPLLRKDFIYEPYQVYESRVYGADCLLLIVAILTLDKLVELIRLSRELNMNCLVEVHTEAEVEIALNSSAQIIGINNRDLNTFTVDLSTTERLRPLIPTDRIVVSESGIRNRDDIEKLKDLSVDAVLIGESLMSAPDIGAKVRELL